MIAMKNISFGSTNSLYNDYNLYKYFHADVS